MPRGMKGGGLASAPHLCTLGYSKKMHHFTHPNRLTRLETSLPDPAGVSLMFTDPDPLEFQSSGFLGIGLKGLDLLAVVNNHQVEVRTRIYFG